MARIGRAGLSDEQKREVWRRWKEGFSLSEIGRVLAKVPGSIHAVVAANGGFVPEQRRRAAGQLSLAEREEISRGLAGGESLPAIAARLGRAPSTISREVAREGGRRKYRAARADEDAWQRARRPRTCLLARHAWLRDTVADKLAQEAAADRRVACSPPSARRR